MFIKRSVFIAFAFIFSSNTAIAEASCNIKGNISKRGKIYHVPGSRSYAQTNINEANGEKWFCSEEQAKLAGWRPSNSKHLKRPVKDSRDCQPPKKHPSGCTIKGNYSEIGKIYHVICSDYYFETVVNEKDGDKWLCSEEQARTLGWSKAGEIYTSSKGKTNAKDCLKPKDEHPAGCDIKGNISRSGRIYHKRCTTYYYETKIRPLAGEQWFCNEKEALDAGWRAPKRTKYYRPSM